MYQKQVNPISNEKQYIDGERTNRILEKVILINPLLEMSEFIYNEINSDE